MMEFILGIVIGAAAIYLLGGWLVRRLIAKMEQKVSAAEQTNLIIRARVEQIDNQFYIYNMDKNEFLVQGRNMKELVDNLGLRKPGAVIGVVDGDEQAIQNLKATAQ
jgi:hypothetical protein